MGSDTATPQLNAALAKVQAELPHVGTDAEAQVPGGRTHKYAALDAVSNAIIPVLGKHGLALTMWPTTTDGRFVLIYRLLHASGEHMDGEYPLPDKATPHQIGSHLTYARRYILCSITGLAPGGEDDDGAAAQQEVTMDRPRDPRGHQWMNRPLDTPRGNQPQGHAPTTGADHERLRTGTVEAAPGDRPASRSRRQPDDDPWAHTPGAPEDRPGSAQTAQVRAIQMAYQKLGFNSRADRNQILATSEQLIGRALEGPNDGKTHNNLAYNEARKLKDTLEAFGEDRGALLERLAGVTREPPAVDDPAPQDAAEGSQDPDPAEVS